MKSQSFPFTSNLRYRLLCGLGGLTLACPLAHGAPVVYTGSDVGAGPTDPRPNSNVVASQYDPVAAASGPLSFFTFELSPVGSFSNLNLGSGVSVSGADISGNPQSIANSPSYTPQPSVGGYNTTLNGTNYLYVQGGTATFTFSNPIDSFGAFFTGVQTVFGTVTLTFNDGSDRVVTVPAEPDASGGVSFVGFTDSGARISSLTVVAGSGGAGDFIGVDDVRVTFAAVPEPTTWGLLSLGTAGAGIVALRRRQRAV